MNTSILSWWMYTVCLVDLKKLTLSCVNTDNLWISSSSSWKSKMVSSGSGMMLKNPRSNSLICFSHCPSTRYFKHVANVTNTYVHTANPHSAKRLAWSMQLSRDLTLNLPLRPMRSCWMTRKRCLALVLSGRSRLQRICWACICTFRELIERGECQCGREDEIYWDYEGNNLAWAGMCRHRIIKENCNYHHCLQLVDSWSCNYKNGY